MFGAVADARSVAIFPGCESEVALRAGIIGYVWADVGGARREPTSRASLSAFVPIQERAQAQPQGWYFVSLKAPAHIACHPWRSFVGKPSLPPRGMISTRPPMNPSWVVGCQRRDIDCHRRPAAKLIRRWVAPPAYAISKPDRGTSDDQDGPGCGTVCLICHELG